MSSCWDAGGGLASPQTVIVTPLKDGGKSSCWSGEGLAGLRACVLELEPVDMPQSPSNHHPLAYL